MFDRVYSISDQLAQQHHKMNTRAVLRFSTNLRLYARSKSIINTKGEEKRWLTKVSQHHFSTKSDPNVIPKNAASPRLDATTKRLVLNLSGVEEHYPWVWLRDSCQCGQCHEPVSSCRVVNLTEWDLNIKPASVKVLIWSSLDRLFSFYISEC